MFHTIQSPPASVSLSGITRLVFDGAAGPADTYRAPYRRHGRRADVTVVRTAYGRVRSGGSSDVSVRRCSSAVTVSCPRPRRTRGA